MGERPVAALTDHLGYWLRLVSNAISGGFAARLSAHEVSVADWVLMRELFETDSLLPSQLAGRLGMTRGGISKLADRLEARGFVARHSRPEDGRSVALALTLAGRALVPALAALADANDAAFLGHLDAEERARLLEMLRRVAQHHGLATIPID